MKEAETNVSKGRSRVKYPEYEHHYYHYKQLTENSTKKKKGHNFEAKNK